MGVLEVRTPGLDEYELPPQSLPALTADVPHNFADLRNSPRGELYIEATVTNNGTGTLTMRDPEGGRSLVIQPGQTAAWELEPGAHFINATASANTLAGNIVVILRVRRRA